MVCLVTMSVHSAGEKAVEILRDRTGSKLRDRVGELFVESRDDVYRYLLTLGLDPPRAQEAAQEVFLRLYATLRKGEIIENPRASSIKVITERITVTLITSFLPASLSNSCTWVTS